MKLYKLVVVIVLLITVSLTLFGVYAKVTPNTGSKGVITSNATSSDSDDELSLDSSMHLSDKDIKNIMREIDSRVKEVKGRLNYEFYKDHYDRDIPVFRYFNRGVVEQDSYADYCLYYNEQGKLIYADITHYRGALYSIYFHDDELLHVEVGPFSEGGLFIKGDMANVKAVIKKDPSYAFVLEDNSLCLEYAYKNPVSMRK